MTHEPPWEEFARTMRVFKPDSRVIALGRKLPADLARLVDSFLPIRNYYETVDFSNTPVPDSAPARVIKHAYLCERPRFTRSGFGFRFDTIAQARTYFTRWSVAVEKYPELVELTYTPHRELILGNVQWWTVVL